MPSNLFDFPEVVVVEASAGSGKTYTLAKRYVQLILFLSQTTALPIQSILAITFTNKATLEMKSRILDFLKRIALKKLKPYEVQDILLPLQIDAEKASKLAYRLMEDVIHQYHYFQVQTIDSFINALLAGCSFKIGLSARFKIQRNSRDYLELALDELLQASYTNAKIRHLFDAFVRQYLFLENRGGWFPKKDLIDVMSALFGQYNTYQVPLIAYPHDEDVFKKKRNVYHAIKELYPLIPQETNKRFLTHVHSFLANNSEIFDVDQLKDYWAKEEFPINKGGEVSPALQKLWNQIHRDIHDLCWLESHSVFNAYIELFQVVLHEFYDISKRDDILFLEELNRKAGALFDEGAITVEELYFRLAARFRHYLIDEFQDTSLAQWRNLASMVEEAMSAQGSLFYVGDKKQAIYAFRGGESRLFDALQRQWVEYVQIQNLEKNFRSFPNIIKFNNCVFNIENLKEFLERKRSDDQENKREGIYFSEDDFELIANSFGHSQQEQGLANLEGGVVRASYLVGKTKKEYCAQARIKLIETVQELRQRFNLKDIAILTRGNAELEEITQWLMLEGIAAQSERNSDIKNNPLIAEIIALLRFLHSPIDNNAFAQFCLGELLPKASGISTEELRDFLFRTARRKKAEKDIYFYKCFREEFPKVWESLFEDVFRHVGVYPLYDLTAALLAKFRCELHFPSYQGFILHLLQLVKNREEQSCDLGAFLDYYEDLKDSECFVPMAEAEAVKILTVHKSKGLEFPVVIIPFLEMDIKPTLGGRDGAQTYVLDIQEQGMNLVRMKERYRFFCPELQTKYESEYKRAFLMELNLVYVALTRAVEELYVFIPPKSGNSINPACFLLSEECFHLGEPSLKPKTHIEPQGVCKVANFIDDGWLPKLKEEFLSNELVSPKAAQAGEALHKALSKIGDSALFLSEEENTMLAPIFAAEHLSPFFVLSEGVQVLCEQEFVNQYGDTKRIDRLIVFKDEIWLVDYKSSRAGEGKHKAQVEEYRALVQSFYKQHRVKAFIIYLDSLDLVSL